MHNMHQNFHFCIADIKLILKKFGPHNVWVDSLQIA